MNMDKERPRLVYIMAPSYSGSTLLTYLLAMHPRIATVGELKASAMGYIDAYHCSCGALLRECLFWKKVLHATEKKRMDFSLDFFGTHFRSATSCCDLLLRTGVRKKLFESIRTSAIKLYPSCHRQLLDIIEQNRCLIEIVKNIQNKDIFLDGSKDPNRIQYLLDAGHWDIKIIYFIRDGRGVTNSYMKHNDVSMEIAAKEWVIVHSEADRIAEQFSDRVKTFHYEDLCSSPDDVLKEILRFVGLSGEGLNSDFRTVEHHILGNQMRMASTSNVRLDEKWKTELEPNDIETFNAIAGESNNVYGYR